VVLLKKSSIGSFGGLSYVLNFGFTMAAAIIVAYFLGTWLDRKFDTEPWCLIGTLLWFIGAAFVKLFQVTKTCNRK
jgi:F0F1-type ATP synthase assembly protein I